ncbi:MULTISPECIES: site-2 protease family protein [Actinoalloteichus]|uniref:Zinc metalloprotease n=1 Tax=Actinoalloteichus fjordicus TaxID=1612552 RepID=A0AAC9LE51_9PSEU|nr:MULTISPECIES: site-2 protease family protein [Actinoalloteichus]APU14624.1 Zn-dependent protease [Actinoalloteichus fjordicus]APU20592.1 Zn-dependent protease [Actinoalloteichus sp. GBA129-24]
MPAASRPAPSAGSVSGLLLLRVSGVPVLLAPSWWLISLLIVALYTPLVRRLLPDTGLVTSALLAAAFALLLGVSVLLHELGHCFVALRLGLPVRRIRLQFLGGVAELVRTPARAGQEGLIAAAGPAVSLALAAFFAGLLPIIEPRGVLWLLVVQVAVANAVVGAFNLLPGLPLDGGRVLRAAVWAVSGRRVTGTRAAAVGGTLVAVLLAWWAAAGLLAGSDDRWLRLGACVIMIWFIAMGISAELAVTGRRVWPPELRLAELTRPVLQLPSESPVADALAASAGRGVVLVRADGVAVGLLDRRAAEELAVVSPSSPAEYATEAITAENVVLDSESGEEIAERVLSTSAWQFLVVDADGRPCGVLRREELRAALDAG